jgi:hypothetical protein
MGADGPALFKLIKKNKIPVLMFTVCDVSAKNLVKPIQENACLYIPKHKMADIDSYLADVIYAKSKGSSILKK